MTPTIAAAIIGALVGLVTIGGVVMRAGVLAAQLTAIAVTLSEVRVSIDSLRGEVRDLPSLRTTHAEDREEINRLRERMHAVENTITAIKLRAELEDRRAAKAGAA